MKRRRGIEIALATALLLAALAASPAGAPRAATERDADPAHAFELANATFAEGRYDEAADAFAAIAAQQGASSALLFNLGNACFRAGRIGDAVLAYEQALVLEPRSSSIAANLRQVRGAANLTPPETGAVSALVSRLTVDGWARLASACLAIGCAALAAGRLLRARLAAQASALRAIRLTTSVAFVAAALAAGATWQSLRQLDRAVVVGDDLALRVAPFASATTSSPVGTGEVVVRERLHEGYALVRTADGRSGWLPTEHVRRVGDLPLPASQQPPA